LTGQPVYNWRLSEETMFRKRNLTLFVGAILLSVAAVIGALPAELDPSPAERDSAVRVVRVASVEQSGNTRHVRIPGVTRSVRRAALAFTIAARVVERPVEIGDVVRAGQVVARLDANEYTLANRGAAATLAELDARLDQARRDEARVARLAVAKAATTEELEKVQAGTATLAAAREAALARVEETRRRLDEVTLRAPFDGTVTKVAIEPGEWASPGSTVVELSGRNGTEVRIEVSESMRSKINPGSAVQVDLPMSGTSVGGTVSVISDAAVGSGWLFPVIVAIDGSEVVVPGMTAEVILSLEASSELTVPLSAVLDSGSREPSVFRIDDGVASRVVIRPGQLLGDRLTVHGADLPAGAMVAVVGHTALVDGDRVEVR
jgi:RND family efflux transporter MFP subunit